jgi:protein-disulfide isomerase
LSDDEQSDSAITIRVRRVHLWALAGLLIGLGGGVAIGRATAPDPRPILYGVPPGGAASAQSSPASQTPVKVSIAGRPARGPVDAKVTMVEFVDYQCPFCGRYARETLPLVEKAYGSRIRYVSRHFPLSIHQHAMGAAIAAECAFRLGRFWQFHTLLFAHQDMLDARGMASQARKAGMDAAAFGTCTRSKAARAAVDRDVADGRRYGVTGTPAFFVNGTPLRGAQPFAQFKAVIDAALKKAG